MWDPAGALGQLQNQAYGYLFPVGPFHLALGSAGVPEWVVQRLWWTTVLAVGFLGVWRLSGALGMGDPVGTLRRCAVVRPRPSLPVRGGSDVRRGLADGSRALGVAAPGAARQADLALADPLVRAGLRRDWRRERRRLGGCPGGSDRCGSPPEGPAKLAAARFATWLAAVVAVALWWLIPLALLGRYSPPFLDWIENARVTTAFASPFEAVRGTTPWLNYLSGPAGPAWPAGWQFVTLPALVVATTMLAALGLAGLRLAPRRHRAFLGLSRAGRSGPRDRWGTPVWRPRRWRTRAAAAGRRVGARSATPTSSRWSCVSR